MIRRIFATAVPAALVAVGMSLALSEPASSQGRGGFYIIPSGMPQYQLNSGGGGGANTNTNQVYPNHRRGMPLPDMNNMHGFQLTAKSGRG